MSRVQQSLFTGVLQQCLRPIVDIAEFRGVRSVVVRLTAVTGCSALNSSVLFKRQCQLRARILPLDFILKFHGWQSNHHYQRPSAVTRGCVPGRDVPNQTIVPLQPWFHKQFYNGSKYRYHRGGEGRGDDDMGAGRQRHRADHWSVRFDSSDDRLTALTMNCYSLRAPNE